MGFFGGRAKGQEVRPEAKWDFISLKDFRSSSCWPPLAYGILWYNLILSCAVYGVDTFTAVNLLAYDQLPSTIEFTKLIPTIVTKWIFSICIILSFVNLGYEHIRAMRIMKRGSVAECFLDSLAARLESARLGQGQGWRRFLVFAELAKSKKGAEYIALFTYFSFQSWIRVIICSGPRQVVNALTLYAVYNSKLIPTQTGSLDTTLLNFFQKLETLAKDQTQTAVILSGMIFTLVIWVFAALSLLLAALFYVFFLWHHIPKQDGGLSGYCERKVNKRLMAIVSKKVNKALEKEERDRLKAELKAAKKAGITGEKPMMARQATLPTLMNDGNADALPEMPKLERSETMSSLSTSTRQETPGSIEMSSFDQGRPLPRRQGTSNTFVSQSGYSANASLLGEAAPMGMARTASPAPTLPQLDLNNYPPVRPGTSNSNRSFGPAPTLQRSLTGASSSFGAPYASSPSTYSAAEPTLPMLPPSVRSPLGGSMDSYGRSTPRPVNQMGGRPLPPGSIRSGYNGLDGGRSSPAPSLYSEPPAAYPARGQGMSGSASGYSGSAFTPLRSASANPEAATRQPQYPPQRNMTAPVPQQRPYDDDELHITRSGTPVGQGGAPRSDFGRGNDLESQRGGDHYY